VLDRLQKGREEMLAIRNFGEKSLEELLEAVEEKGYMEYLAGTEFNPDGAAVEVEEGDEEEVTA
jgi:DNA-directed RNA polymerase alpha subunit